MESTCDMLEVKESLQVLSYIFSEALNISKKSGHISPRYWEEFDEPIRQMTYTLEKYNWDIERLFIACADPNSFLPSGERIHNNMLNSDIAKSRKLVQQAIETVKGKDFVI